MTNMTINQINDHIIAFHPILLTVVKGLLAKQHKTHIDPNVVISEAYIHLIKNKENCTDTVYVEKLLVNFAKKNIGWTNSSINKQEKITSQIDMMTELYMHEDSNQYHQIELDDDIDITNKIKIEDWYTTRLFILDEYYHQLTDPVKKRIYEVYFYNNKKKGKDFAAHFQSTRINKDYAAKLIREMKADIKTFYNNNYINTSISGC